MRAAASWRLNIVCTRIRECEDGLVPRFDCEREILLRVLHWVGVAHFGQRKLERVRANTGRVALLSEADADIIERQIVPKSSIEL